MKKRPYLLAGKVGNIVYQRNRFGQISYERFIPANPRTPKQMRVRGHWARVVALWAALQQWQRDLWNAAGAKQRTRKRFGRSYPLTGYNYFIRENMRRVNRGEELVEVPPRRLRGADGRWQKKRGAERGACCVVRSPEEGRWEGLEGGEKTMERHFSGGAPVGHRRGYGILIVVGRCWRGVGTVAGAAQEAIRGGLGVRWRRKTGFSEQRAHCE